MKNANSFDNIVWEANFAKNKGKTFNIDINGTIFTKTATTPDDFKDVLKHLWKKAFTENADNAFDAIWGNANMKNNLFEDMSRSEAKIDFNEMLNTLDDELFKFIKAE